MSGVPGPSTDARADESALTARAAAGDEDALVLLLERHGASVRAQLFGQIPPQWQAVLSMDDVMQETYADAFTSVRRFQPRGATSFLAWLVALARCNLRDGLRLLGADKRGGDRKRLTASRGPEWDQSCMSLCELLGANTSTPSRDAARNEGTSELLRAMEDLPPAQKEVVRLYDLLGQDAADVAAAVGRSEGAMFMLRARAHRRLAELMGTESQYFSRQA